MSHMTKYSLEHFQYVAYRPVAEAIIANETRI